MKQIASRPFFWIAVFIALELHAAERPPNIVLLLADDLGYGELNTQDDSRIPTPHIDRLTRNGVRFTQAYVTAPFCSASRAGLLTGRYQARFGYDFNPIGAQNELPTVGLPPSETTFARLLHDVGYATALVGKWHLGGAAAYHPLRRGFDEFFGFTHEGHFYVPPPYRGATTMLRRRGLPSGGRGRWTSPDGRLILTTHMGYDEPAYDANNPIVRDGQPVREPEYLTDALTREAVDFIERNQTRPFFLYLSYNAVHSPLQAADSYVRRFASIDDVHRRLFAAMLSHLDDSVGTVVDRLAQLQLLDDTLIVFLSDNGGPTRELTSSNLPLRGEKGNLYEGGVRVPMVWHWPGHVPAGEVYEHPVLSLDIAATALTLAGQADRVGDMDGVNLVPFVTGDDARRPHEQLFWRVGHRAAIRVGNWKAVMNSRSQAGKWELFDLANDISESNDQAATHADRLAKLRARWESFNANMAQPMRW